MIDFFKKPRQFKIGQIWSCKSINEGIVLTEVNPHYLKMGIIRGMLISRATHLDDGKDFKFKPKNRLKIFYTLERVALRITDGPILVDELAIYLGKMPKNLVSKIPKRLKQKPELNPVQEEFVAKLLEKLQPLRTKVLAMSDEF